MSSAAVVLQQQAHCAWQALGRREGYFQGGIRKTAFVLRFSMQIPKDGICCRRSGVAPRAKSFSDFGAPQRRLTDSLLVFNTLIFAAQLLTKQRLTVAGIKVHPHVTQLAEMY